MIHNMDCECNCIAPSVDMDNRTYSDHKTRSCNKKHSIISPNDDKLITILTEYFKANSVSYKDFCNISINTRFDENGNKIGDSSSTKSSIRSNILSLIQDIISVYSDHGNICYIVGSNNIIIGVTWIDNIRNPLIE